MTISTLNKILFVDDETDIQEIVAISLEQIGGFSLKVASSGKEALSIIAEFNPELILLDVMLPVMDGPAILKEIRNMPQFAEVPVIFMTAKAQAYEIEEYKKMGAVDVIVKPFDPMLLPVTINNIWENLHGQSTGTN